MKKTVSVNIRGINFIIEEDAYELLQQYLDRLSVTLKNEQGSREIIEDIELRIAELCLQKLNTSKTVIELSDIQEIISVMGDPSQYIDEDESFETKQEPREDKTTSEKDSDKKLYRDTDNAVIAGVCAGIASFLKIDVVIIRAIFVIMFLFAGFGFPLYLILWVIVPKTRSTIDRLRMKGKPITVETVREEVEIAAENITKGSKRFAQQLRNDDTYSKSIRNGARIIGTLFGIGLVFIGITLLVPFLIFIIGGFEFIPVANESGFVSFPEFGEFVLTNSSDYNLMVTGILLVGFSSIIFLLLSGSMFIFKIRNRWAKTTLFLLFLSGLTGGIISAVVGIRTGKDFIQYSEIEVEVGSVYTNELLLFPQERTLNTEGKEKIKSNSRLSLMEVDGNDVRLYGVHIKYVPSSDSLFHITKELSAHGRSQEAGLERCQNIDQYTEIAGDSLYVNTYYEFPKEDKLRDQEVQLVIQIPKGGTVRIKDRIITLDGIEPQKDEYDYEQDGYLRGNGKYKHYN